MSLHYIFKGLTEAELKMLLQSMEECHFSQGDVIIEQGAEPAGDECLYVVMSGEAEVVVHGTPEEQMYQVLERGKPYHPYGKPHTLDLN
eukprot:3410328-Pyramimonas_sp.AAC.1